jgi:hypothetical protein
MTDILLDDDLDLLIVNGDIVFGDADEQNMRLVALSNTGDWKEFPQFGVNLRRALLDEGAATAVKHTLQLQLEADGALVESIALEPDGQLKINARYGTDNS